MHHTDDLETLVRAQAEQIRALSDRVEALQRHVAELGDVPPSATPAGPSRGAAAAEVAGCDQAVPSGPPGRPLAVDVGPEAHVERPARREVLRRAGAAVAGGAVGGAAAVLATASPAAAAPGVFDGSPAVSATSAGGTAVQALGAGLGVFAEASSASSTGVWARGKSTGVLGEDTGSGGVGVEGSSQFGVALRAELSGLGRAHVLLASYASIPPPYLQSGMHEAGELLLDRDRVLWLCVTSGGPGVWRRVGGPSTAGNLTMLTTPVRVYDSRPGNPPSTGPKARLGDGWSREIDCSVSGTVVPVTSTAILVNVTVVNTSATGFLTAFAHGAAVPAASTINWNLTGSIVANTTIVRCADGRVDCYVPPGSSTDVFLDVVGYFL